MSSVELPPFSINVTSLPISCPLPMTRLMEEAETPAQLLSPRERPGWLEAGSAPGVPHTSLFLLPKRETPSSHLKVGANESLSHSPQDAGGSVCEPLLNPAGNGLKKL